MNSDALRVNYNLVQDVLERVENNLEYLLQDARKEFRSKHPDIAIPKHPEIRIKEFAKIISKLERKGLDWPYDTIFIENDDGGVTTIVNDVVAGKLVCATLNDVDKLAAILMGWSTRLSDLKSETVFNAKTGYRAYHIDAKLGIDHGARRLFFPVEIQIKTLLQDAWANFDHDELYKPSEEPPEITKKVSCYVADVLLALDQIGEAIRDEKFKKRPAPSTIGKEETLITPRTISYLVNEIYKATMNEVELQKSVAQLRAFEYLSVASVDALARDERIVTNVEVAKTQLHLSNKLTPYEILYFGPVAAKEGIDGVIRELRRVYSLTEITCGGCKGPISEDDKSFQEKQTDLDEIYYCSQCRVTKLRKCRTCEKYTESDVCKDCRSRYLSTEVL